MRSAIKAACVIGVLLPCLLGCNRASTPPTPASPRGKNQEIPSAAATAEIRTAEPTREQQAEEARKEAEREEAALVAVQQYISDKYHSSIEPLHGRRFRVDHQIKAVAWLEELTHAVPRHDYADVVSMYKAIGGFDGSTTQEALAECQRSFVGKYYVLQGDVFQIQADRDYARDGENEFMLFGEVNLPPYLPVNVAAISEEKIPPYRTSPMLTKIIGFDSGTNRAGQPVIIPRVEVIVAVSLSVRNDPSDVVVSKPSVVAELLHLPVDGSASEGERLPDSWEPLKQKSHYP